MSNPYCEPLGIKVPVLEELIDHREADRPDSTDLEARRLEWERIREAHAAELAGLGRALVQGSDLLDREGCERVGACAR